MSVNIEPIIQKFTKNGFIKFDNDSITETCLRKPLFPHPWANKSNITTLLLNNEITINNILEEPLNNFGECDILTIKDTMEKERKKTILSPPPNLIRKISAIEELFKIKHIIKYYKPKLSSTQLQELEAKLRESSKQKFEKLKPEAKKEQQKDEVATNTLMEKEILPSTTTSATTALADEIDELDLEARLAALNSGGSKSVKRRKTHRQKSIKRTRSIKRRGTKQRQRKVKRRRTKSRR